MTRIAHWAVTALLGSAVLGAVALADLVSARAHEAHRFSAGLPGDPKKPSRAVHIAMREDGKKMMYDPNRIEIRKGEQIRFILDNDGLENHEFVLATVGENRQHAEVMKKHPHMEHDDPNAKRLAPFTRSELVWKFTKAGEFEYACLIPGHYEAGMFGKIIVK